MSDSDNDKGCSGCLFVVRLWPVWVMFAVILFVMYLGLRMENAVETIPQDVDDTVVDEFTQVDWPGVCASAFVLPVVLVAAFVLKNR